MIGAVYISNERLMDTSYVMLLPQKIFIAVSTVPSQSHNYCGVLNAFILFVAKQDLRSL